MTLPSGGDGGGVSVLVEAAEINKRMRTEYDHAMSEELPEIEELDYEEADEAGGVIGNKQSTDVESTPPPPRDFMRGSLSGAVDRR